MLNPLSIFFFNFKLIIISLIIRTKNDINIFNMIIQTLRNYLFVIIIPLIFKFKNYR